MATLFISDLHLEDKRPEMTGVLLAFLARRAPGADALYILGDLFEYWIGDDALSPTAQAVAKGIRRLSDSGVPCFFMHGNRDFLIGADYARQAGFELLPDPTIVDLYGTPTLLMHGDTLCTDDVAYQEFRRQVRHPGWQKAFLSRSIEERLEVAQQARDASRKHTSSAAMEIMDVNPGEVLAAFEQHGVRRMIHGHTHRPAHHRLKLENGEAAERIVLADWYRKGSALRVDPEGVETIAL